MARPYLRTVRTRWILPLLVLALVLLVPGEAWAQGCAMCKATVESAEEGQAVFGGQQSIGRGLNVGILFLIPVPYILLFLLFRRKIMGFFREFANAQG